MNRRKFIKSLGLAAFGMSMSGCLPGRSFGRNDPAEKQPPNVILLLTDDMGYGDIAAHGNPIIKTPNFDALHSQSARFTNFAVSPTCAPTRAALLTGKHEFLSGVTHTISPMNQLNMEANIIPQLFKKKGYKTGLFGKWHLGQEGEYGPWNRGFDETLTVPGDKQDSHFNPVLLKNQVETKFKGYRTDILFDEAMKFIEQHKEQPFFIYLPTYSPHGPLKVPEKYIDPYMPLKEREEYKGLKVPPPFFGMVANVDENLGRLMAKLEELGIDDDTILIAINDNGGTNGVDVWNAGMRGMKSTAWLGGIRAYSFWKWGDRFSVGDRPQMSGHIDVLPTLADLCGLEISDELQAQLEGDSLLPALENAEAQLDGGRMQVYHVGRWIPGSRWNKSKYKNCGVRWKQYIIAKVKSRKNSIYTKNPDNCVGTKDVKGWALFDLASDPFQKNNIADQHPEIVKKIADHYEAWWKKVEVALTERWKT